MPSAMNYGQCRLLLCTEEDRTNGYLMQLVSARITEQQKRSRVPRRPVCAAVLSTVRQLLTQGGIRHCAPQCTVRSTLSPTRLRALARKMRRPHAGQAAAPRKSQHISILSAGWPDGSAYSGAW